MDGVEGLGRQGPWARLFTITCFKFFLVCMAFFMVFLAIVHLMARDPSALKAFNSSAVLLVCTSLVYFLLSRYVPRSGRSSWPRAGAPGAAAKVWYLFLGLSLVNIAVFFIFAKTSASLELVRQLLDRQYVPPYDELQMRLGASLLPLGVELFFEIVRRFVFPACWLGYYFTDGLVRKRPLLTFLVWAILAFNVLCTLERSVPVMYVVIFYMAYFFKHRNKYIIFDKQFYVALLAIMLITSSFKMIQYGKIRLPSDMKTDYMAQIMHSKEGTGSASGAAPQGSLVSFAVSSTIGRVALSPVIMILYAYDNYNESNFLHWSSTRLFSFLGLARYVHPLEKPTLKYHDAFPVTMIGDIWRNGGYLYFPVFGVFLAGLLFVLDRLLFSGARAPVWQSLSLCGVAFFFYGNAFNCSSVLLIGGSLSLYLLFGKAGQAATEGTPSVSCDVP